MHQPFTGPQANDTGRADVITHRRASGSSQQSPVESRARTLPHAIALTKQVEARKPLASELRALALDMLGLYQPEDVPAECAAWVRTTVEAAVSDVCDPAIAALTRRLNAELRLAPSDVARRIDDARLRREAGFA
jgi:hypothetical protein